MAAGKLTKAIRLTKPLRPTKTATKRYSERDLLMLIHSDSQKALVGIGALIAIQIATPVVGSTPLQTASELLVIGASVYTLLMLTLSRREGWITGTKLRFAVMLAYLLLAVIIISVGRFVGIVLDQEVASPLIAIGFSLTLIWWALSIPIRPPAGFEPEAEPPNP